MTFMSCSSFIGDEKVVTLSFITGHEEVATIQRSCNDGMEESRSTFLSWFEELQHMCVS